MVAAAVAAAQGLLGYTLRAAEAPEEFPFGLGKSVCGRSLGSLSVPGRHGGDAGRRGLNSLRRATLGVLGPTEVPGHSLSWQERPWSGAQSPQVAAGAAQAAPPVCVPRVPAGRSLRRCGRGCPAAPPCPTPAFGARSLHPGVSGTRHLLRREAGVGPCPRGTCRVLWFLPISPWGRRGIDVSGISLPQRGRVQGRLGHWLLVGPLGVSRFSCRERQRWEPLGTHQHFGVFPWWTQRCSRSVAR